MENWRDQVVVLPESITPPSFMRRAHEGDGGRLKEIRDLIRKHYQQIRRKHYEQGGYTGLAKVADRLEDRLSEVIKRYEQVESRKLYVEAQHVAFRDKYSEQETTLNSGDSKESDPLIRTPIGNTWLNEGNVEPPNDNAWEIELHDDNKSQVALHEVKICNRPEDEFLKNLGPGHPDYNPEATYPYDTLIFTGEQSWKEVFEKFENRIGSLRKQFLKLSRTRDLLDFRFGIADRMLYEIEIFGEVEGMDKDNADDLVSEQLPDIFKSGSELLKHAEEVQQIYQQERKPLPGKMKRLKARLGVDGDSKVTQLQTKIREEGLSEYYEDGDPESFCYLIVQLVKQHYRD